jgi:hypothetical protein
MLTKNSAAVEIRTKKKTMDDCMNLSTVKKSISQKMTGSKVSSSGPKDKAKDQPPLDYNTFQIIMDQISKVTRMEKM